MDTQINFPFPQADDFEKIIKIICIEEPSRYIDKPSMSRYLDDISERQVQYYLSACMYLGIIDADKNLTSLGIKLRSMNNSDLLVELIRIVLSDKVFGNVYIFEKYLGIKYTRNDVETILRNNTNIENEAVIHRRAQTVIKWVEWINSTLNS